MKLDATDLRYITPDEFRVLGAVEHLSRSHLSVPTALIASQLAQAKGSASAQAAANGGIQKCLGSLAKRGLVGKVIGVKYDGYRLTYGGYDFLALKTFSRRASPSITSVGQRVGVGKEGDVYIVKGKGKGPMLLHEDEDGRAPSVISRKSRAGYGADEEDEEEEMRVLKIHRLGRISFRAIKEKRDYLGSRKSASWMYMSRLAAEKEFAFMQILYEHDFPVPIPYDQSRHSIVMSYIDGFPLRSISDTLLPIPDLFARLMALLVRLARHGLIHGDFNEFNIMIRDEDGEPVVIDFPQMVSVRHANAGEFFDRDVQCVRKFFRKRFRFESTEYPTWRSIRRLLPAGVVRVDEAGEGESDEEEEDEEDVGKEFPRLDLLVEASGFNRAMQSELESYMNEVAGMSDPEDLSELSDEDGESTAGESSGSETEGEEELVAKTRRMGVDAEGDSSSSGSEDGSEEEGSDDSDDDTAPSLVPASTSGGTHRSHATSRSHASRTSDARQTVSADLVKQRVRTETKHHARKGVHGAGKAKGHKWKTSAATLVGKNGADGW